MSQKQFHELYNFISQRTAHHVQDSPDRSPRLALPKFRLTSFIQPSIMSAMFACSSSLMFVLLASIYNNQRPEKSRHCLLHALRYYNENQKKINVKARGFQILYYSTQLYYSMS